MGLILLKETKIMEVEKSRSQTGILESDLHHFLGVDESDLYHFLGV